MPRKLQNIELPLSNGPKLEDPAGLNQRCGGGMVVAWAPLLPLSPWPCHMLGCNVGPLILPPATFSPDAQMIKPGAHVVPWNQTLRSGEHGLS
jgi:hypothetical protein